MTSVLGMASNLECLLPFVEHAGKNIFDIINMPASKSLLLGLCCLFSHVLFVELYKFVVLEKLSSDSKDSKSKKSVSSRYASVLILLTIQGTPKTFLKVCRSLTACVRVEMGWG